MNFVGCTLEKLTDSTHLLLCGEAWFELSGYVKSHSNGITMLLIHEVRVCDV
jgi:hypothetical protein